MLKTKLGDFDAQKYFLHHFGALRRCRRVGACGSGPIGGAVFGFSGDAIGSSITATIKLGSSYLITDLQARFIKLADGNYQTITGPVTAPNTVLNAWTTAIGTAGATASFSEESLSAGTYILQIRGLASGTNGGVYTGSLELTPVPLPAAAWLLLSGLAGLTSIRRNR